MQLIDYTKIYKQEEPVFGRPVLEHYFLDPEYINLNNGTSGDRSTDPSSGVMRVYPIVGSYGTTPKPVLEAINQLTIKIETNPDLFHRVEYKPLLVNARQKVADLIGANLDEVVLVSNASMGVNTILRNFDWEEGDIIFSCGYL